MSFEVITDPPRLSRCSVYSPDLTASAALRVTGADGDFVLLRVNFPARDDDNARRRPAFADFFVYRAGASPSLDLLPLPYPVDLLASHVVGVLVPRRGPLPRLRTREAVGAERRRHRPLRLGPPSLLDRDRGVRGAPRPLAT